jgi:hypothetical protein
MKRMLIVVSILLGFVGVALAQNMVTANQITITWDAVAPIATGDVIKYQIYTKFGVTTATPQKVGSEITAVQSTITFNVEGRYYPCVQTVRYPTGETIPLVSGFACSDVAADTNNLPFGVKYFVVPGTVKNLRRTP